MTEEEQRDAPGGRPEGTTAPADAGAHAGDVGSEGTEAADGPEGAEAPAARRKLSRSRSHKVAGGVCGGLGRYFDLDPVIFRVPLVVLSVVGGLGLVFYGFAWLLIPAEGEKENEGRRLLSGRVEGPALSAILVALVGCGLFLASLGSRSVPYSVLLIGAVAGAAYWSQHRRQAEAAGAEGAEVDPTTAHAVADAPPETQAPPVPASPSWWREPLTKEAGAAKGRAPVPPWGGAGAVTGYLWGPEDTPPYAAVPRGAGGRVGAAAGSGAGAWRPPGTPGGVRPPRQSGGPSGSAGGSLGGLVFLVALLAGGISATVSWNAQPLGTTLTTGLSCALAVFGLGLAVSAFVGRVGPGTVICVVLTGGLLAGAAALPEDISGQVRESRWVPVSAKEVKPHYRLGSGSGELDLRETGLKKGQTLRSAVRVGAGRLKVVVPADAIVKVSADVDLGDTSFPRGLNGDGDVTFDSSGGFGQDRRMTLRPFDGATPKGTVELKLSVGIGRAEIVRDQPAGDRSGNTQAPEPVAPPEPPEPLEEGDNR
ncbi:PspC domain-containing protein [Streptomyces sp. NBC_01795]|uniref:PspC domain-containing protein n=1 Tax=Streptomyces sp. NBC_01795 TaxID=2975943 RepID=UPI002DD843AD|nr:PspC domain-containing protein [Streptomyces sp. NBC_01795]WSA92886.1 PspC domain-containing protein [Streptomyces sp. NBC_01795]